MRPQIMSMNTTIPKKVIRIVALLFIQKIFSFLIIVILSFCNGSGRRHEYGYYGNRRKFQGGGVKLFLNSGTNETDQRGGSTDLTLSKNSLTLKGLEMKCTTLTA